MKHEDVKDLPDLLTYMRIHAEGIFVREEIDGKWGSYSLAEMPDRLRGEHEARFIEEGRIPVRILTDEEIKENKENEEGASGTSGSDGPVGVHAEREG